MNFSVKDFFCKSLVENLIFCAVYEEKNSQKLKFNEPINPFHADGLFPYPLKTSENF